MNTCLICGKICQSRQVLMAHVRVYHPKDRDFFHCELCEFRGPTKGSLIGHMKKCHPSQNKMRRSEMRRGSCRDSNPLGLLDPNDPEIISITELPTMPTAAASASISTVTATATAPSAPPAAATAFPPLKIKQEPKDDYSSFESSWHDEEFASLMNGFTDLAPMASTSTAAKPPSPIRAPTPCHTEVKPKETTSEAITFELVLPAEQIKQKNVRIVFKFE